MPRTPRLSIIVPVHNGGQNLQLCIQALAESSRAPDEVIVVDDGSTDGSADQSRRYGACVLRLDGVARGPAFARNRGVEAASGDIVVFIDADVVVHLDTLSHLGRYFVEHPEVAGFFGSYDADPPAKGLVSRYKNLTHHYVHQHGRREASTFWAGCGAVRRDAFTEVGGFDESYTRPSIEDIEFGVRLGKAGHRVWLCPDVLVTHLKHWTLLTLLRSDIRDRAIPWTRLILHDAHLPDDLNLDATARISAVAAWSLLWGLALGFWCSLLWLGTLLAGGALVTMNAGLYRFCWQRGGACFAVVSMGLHWFYLLYSSLIFVGLAVPAWLTRKVRLGR